MSYFDPFMAPITLGTSVIYSIVPTPATPTPTMATAMYPTTRVRKHRKQKHKIPLPILQAVKTFLEQN